MQEKEKKKEEKKEKQEETVMIEVPKALEDDVAKLKREYENEDRTNAMVAFGFVGMALITAVVYVLTEKTKLRMPMILFALAAAATVWSVIRTNGGLKNAIRLVFLGDSETVTYEKAKKEIDHQNR